MSGPAQIQIDLDSAVPVTRQIVDHLRTLLVEGAIGPGESLPSVRRLAIDLGVHFNTVADAYRALAEEGWLEISHGRGVQTRKRTAPAAGDESLANFRRRLRQLVAEVRSEGLTPAVVARELAVQMEALK